MFNSMENVWSSVKAKIKRDLATKITSILRIVPQGLSIKEHRLRALERVDEGRYECRNKLNVLEFCSTNIQ